MSRSHLLIRVQGRVQGVGFRPFVYRLAKQHRINGWIMNRTDAVMIKIEGEADRLPVFMEDLRNQAPVAAQIDEITVDNDFPENLQDFRILAQPGSFGRNLGNKSRYCRCARLPR